MNSADQRFKSNIQNWALAGPTAAFICAFLILFKSASIYWPLIFAASSGILICWQWRIRGFAVALAGLIAIASFHFFQHPYSSIQDVFWNWGLLGSIGLAFFVTALCREEWELISQGQNQSRQEIVQEAIQEPLARLHALEESFKHAREESSTNFNTAQAEWQAERNELSSRYATLEQASNEKDALLQKHENNLEIAQKELERTRKELEATRARQEALEADLCDQRRESKVTDKQLQEAKQELLRLKDAKHHIAVEQEKRVQIENILAEREQDYQNVFQLGEQKLQALREETDRKLQTVRLESDQILQAAQKQAEQNLHSAVKTCEMEIRETFKIRENELKAALNESEHEIILLEEKLKTNRSEVVSLQARLSETQQAFEEVKKHAAHTQSILEQTRLEKEQSQKLYSANEQEMNTLIASLQQEKLALDGALQLLQQEIDALKTEREKILQKLEANRIDRRSEGMFKQLRDQFVDKSSTLDTTRQELFKTQEELLTLQRTWHEQSTFDRTEDRAALERHLFLLDKEFERSQKDFAQEIDALHDLIAQLMQEQNILPEYQ